MAGVSRNSSEGGDDSAIGDEEVEEDDDEALEPLPPVQLPSTTAKYALCVDVLGNTSCLGQSELGCFQAFAEELAKALLRTQRDAVERQVRRGYSSSTSKSITPKVKGQGPVGTIFQSASLGCASTICRQKKC